MLTKHGNDVIGVDASETMLLEATRHAGKLRRRPTFQRVDTIERLTFPSGTFDGILCLSVLEYLDNPDEALSTMARILKPGGVLVFSVPHRRSAVRRLQTARFRLGLCSQGSYLTLSRFSTVQREIRQRLQRRRMRIHAELTFDPILPRYLHWLLTPSLIYVVCEKQVGEASD